MIKFLITLKELERYLIAFSITDVEHISFQADGWINVYGISSSNRFHQQLVRKNIDRWPSIQKFTPWKKLQ